jgi:hypothetical protein
MKKSRHLNSVMDAGNHTKNEASVKSPVMGKQNFFQKICFALWIMAGIVFVTGCKSTGNKAIGNIETVKRSILNDIDDSKTIGDALDKYKYFTKTDWSEFESEDGRKGVEFTGKYYKCSGIVTMIFVLDDKNGENEDGRHLSQFFGVLSWLTSKDEERMVEDGQCMMQLMTRNEPLLDIEGRFSDQWLRQLLRNIESGGGE